MAPSSADSSFFFFLGRAILEYLVVLGILESLDPG